MGFKGKFESRDAVMARLRQFIPEVEAQTAQAQAAVAQDLAVAIKRRAPRRTGEYAASIEAALLASRPAKKQVGISATKDSNAQAIFARYIWRFLEFGTRRMRARPHIFPTYRAMRKTIRRKVAANINKAVRKARKARGD